MNKPEVDYSDIQRFYKNSNVFLTGATGFIGKLFLEKVLRALPVRKVFILIRSKKGVAATTRFQDILEAPIFDLLKRTTPNVFEKIIVLEGDCSLPFLGLKEEDIQTILNEVNVIYHCADTVRFDEDIRKSTYTNVKATATLVDLSKRIQKLKTFVYVGTAFANSNGLEIKEQIYPSKISAENLIAACESLDDDCLSSMTKTLIKDWPNTYTFTKQVTEDYINRKGRDIPICIVRPTIVSSTADEPISAFVDNIYNIGGLILANAMGINRISYYKNTNIDLVPADYVISGCISAGWNTGETFKKQRHEIPVYHISTALDNPISQDNISDTLNSYLEQIPPSKGVMFPLYFRTTSRYNYLFIRFFFHTMVAYIMDMLLKMQGKKPMMLLGIKKLHSLHAAYEYFMTNQFFIHVDNSHKLLKKMSFQDRELFNFDVRNINWENYLAQYIRGVRIYLLKDPMDTVPTAKKRRAYLRNVLIVVLMVTAVLFYGIGKIFLFRVLPFVFGVVAYFVRAVVC